jgi:hypothetical protein
MKTTHILFLLSLTTTLSAQQLAFPEAEGFGRFANGGRGGDVYRVTNLDNDGPGSLRFGIEKASDPRNIVFDISGNIELTNYLRIRSDSMTIAGQTAPGPGICIQGYGLSVSANHVILRHLRFRPGNKYLAPHDEGGFTEDALTLSGDNIIVDHISTSWAIDENLSCGTQWNDITIQSCLIGEALHKTLYYHGEYAPDHNGHSMGSLIKVRGADANATLQHNLWIHNNNRNPAVGSYEGTEHQTVDVRNNVMYNCRSFGYSSGASLQVDMNYIGNYIIAGTNTSSSNRKRAFDANENNHLHIYQWGNKIDGNLNRTFDGINTGWGMFDDTWVSHDSPFEMPNQITYSADQALEIVLADVGALPWSRDAVDQRLIDDLENGTGKIINSQEEVGGYPVLKVVSRPAGWDTDGDGMPDGWESVMGFNPEDSTDGNDDANNDGYTNLEAYLNNRATRLDFLLPPAELKVQSISGTRIDLSWKEAAHNESGFSIERSIEPDNGFVKIQNVNPNITSYSDAGLEPLTIYYYRVRATNQFSQSIYSETVSTITLNATGTPLGPKNPIPNNEKTDVNVGAKLNWSPGAGSLLQQVYFGDTNPPPFLGESAKAFFGPGWLADSTTYFWRVDQVNNAGTTEGPLWQFTTEFVEHKLVAHWSLDAGGAYIADISGNINWGYLKNAAAFDWVPGKANNALLFDGVDTYFYAKNKKLFDFSIRSASIAFWIKTDTFVPASWMAKGIANSGELEKGFAIQMDSDSQLKFIISDSTNRSMVFLSHDDLELNEWIFLTAVRDRESRNLLLYLNGELKASAPDSTWDMSSFENLFIGTDSQAERFYKGLFDEMRIYNYALSENEINVLYQQTLTSVQSHPGPETFELDLTNYPNPFNSSTTIQYSIPVAGKVTINLYNLLGQKQKTLLSENQPSGEYSLRLESTDLNSSTYICTLESSGEKISKKILYLK